MAGGEVAHGSEVAHGGELVLGGGEAGVDRGDLAEPALRLGLAEPVEQVGVDLLQPGHLRGVGPQDWAADAGFAELRSDQHRVLFVRADYLRWVRSR
ncbi:hypothetical protein [Kitasatospora azatica]|uniref:hypothetical protein n=1 Tax=Kitasatospora azatica TaxID=58347 RepID=UPI00056510D7|nr:hypothetical protein [Kitasatospora azatica]